MALAGENAKAMEVPQGKLSAQKPRARLLFQVEPNDDPCTVPDFDDLTLSRLLCVIDHFCVVFTFDHQRRATNTATVVKTIDPVHAHACYPPSHPEDKAIWAARHLRMLSSRSVPLDPAN
jgi:hypothetical protein